MPIIYASVDRASICSENGLSPFRRQAIIQTAAGLLSWRIRNLLFILGRHLDGNAISRKLVLFLCEKCNIIWSQCIIYHCSWVFLRSSRLRYNLNISCQIRARGILARVQSQTFGSKVARLYELKWDCIFTLKWHWHDLWVTYYKAKKTHLMNIYCCHDDKGKLKRCRACVP